MVLLSEIFSKKTSPQLSKGVSSLSCRVYVFIWGGVSSQIMGILEDCLLLCLAFGSHSGRPAVGFLLILWVNSAFLSKFIVKDLCPKLSLLSCVCWEHRLQIGLSGVPHLLLCLPQMSPDPGLLWSPGF